MPVNRDLSSLPRASAATGEGWAPDPQPRFGHLLAEAWAAKNAGRKAHAIEGSRFRHSDAGACSRAVAYAALGVPESNPMDLAGHFIAEQGTLVHEALQNVLMAMYGDDCQVEVKVGEDWHSGHVDVVLTHTPMDVYTEARRAGADQAQAQRRALQAVFAEGDKKVISVEIKTVDGYGYKLAVGERGPAQGPKWQHAVQAALNAAEVDADQSVIIYLARGAISIQAAQRKRIDPMLRFVAEWTQTREQYLPLAEVELRRVGGILTLLDDGMLPARKIPDPELPPRHLIVDPRKGSWVAHDDEGMVIDAGETWQCVYCRYQDLCVQTHAERTPVDVLRQLGVLPEEG
jgi:hypothetical protein